MPGTDYLKRTTHDLVLVATTSHGWQVRTASGAEFSLPRSHCSMTPPSAQVGQTAKWSIPKWLSEKRGLR